MIVDEARWFYENLKSIPSERLTPLLNVGAQDEHYRTAVQPWIGEFVTRPLQARGVEVINLDITAAPGVDLVGDLLDPEFRDHVRALGISSVMCCNVLEHVPDPRGFAQALAMLVPSGGHLILSVPHRFPHHPDPIDNGLRPTPSELTDMFPDLAAVTTALIDGGTIARYAVATIGSRLRARRTPASTRPSGGATDITQVLRLAPWLFRRLEISCAILVRE